MDISIITVGKASIGIIGAFLMAYPSLRSQFINDKGQYGGAPMGYILRDGGRPDPIKVERQRKFRLLGFGMVITSILLSVFIQ